MFNLLLNEYELNSSSLNFTLFDPFCKTPLLLLKTILFKDPYGGGGLRPTSRVDNFMEII
jgi:hypothetical protein